MLLKKALNELGGWGTGEYDAIVHSAGVVGVNLLEVRATLVVDNKRIVINVLLDTGATHTFIAKSFVEKHNIPTTRMERGLRVKVANGAIMQVTQVTRPIPLEFGDHVKRPTRFAVIENDRFDAIIGLNFMAHFRALIDAAARRIVFQDKKGGCFQLDVLPQQADTPTFCNGFIPRCAPEPITNLEEALLYMEPGFEFVSKKAHMRFVEENWAKGKDKLESVYLFMSIEPVYEEVESQLHTTHSTEYARNKHLQGRGAATERGGGEKEVHERREGGKGGGGGGGGGGVRPRRSILHRWSWECR